jgi:hypothetical protein
MLQPCHTAQGLRELGDERCIGGRAGCRKGEEVTHTYNWDNERMGEGLMSLLRLCCMLVCCSMAEACGTGPRSHVCPFVRMQPIFCKLCVCPAGLWLEVAARLGRTLTTSMWRMWRAQTTA